MFHCALYTATSIPSSLHLNSAQFDLSEPQSLWFLRFILHSVLCSYQGEVIGVNPDDAEVRVVCVILGNLLQDLQELKTVWGIEKKTTVKILFWWRIYWTAKSNG